MSYLGGQPVPWCIPLIQLRRADLLAACVPSTSSSGGSGPALAGGKPSLSSIRFLLDVTADPTFIPDFETFQRLQDDHGITVDVQQISGADISIKSLVANQVDIALSSVASGMLAVGQAQTIKQFAPEGSAPYFTLVTTSDINNWSDLAGRTIGITATSDGSYWTTVLQLKKYGVDPSSINWVTVRGTPARVEAMQAGKIDAGQLQIGGALTLLQDPRFTNFAEVGKDYPNLIFSGFWVSNDFIKQHPDVLTAFAQTQMQSNRDAQDTTKYMAVAKPLLADQMDDATLSQAYDIVKAMNIWDVDGSRWTADAGDFAGHTLADYGAIDFFVPFSQWGVTQFEDAARQALGPYAG